MHTAAHHSITFTSCGACITGNNPVCQLTHCLIVSPSLVCAVHTGLSYLSQHQVTTCIRRQPSHRKHCRTNRECNCRLISAPFWLVLIIAGLTCNGGTWFDTACLVTSVRNFPNERGTVVGLLKACVGETKSCRMGSHHHLVINAA